jgi:hypothetical protein
MVRRAAFLTSACRKRLVDRRLRILVVAEAFLRRSAANATSAEISFISTNRRQTDGDQEGNAQVQRGIRQKRGKKVTSKKQAIAIGLSKARKAGKKVPAKAS